MLHLVIKVNEEGDRVKQAPLLFPAQHFKSPPKKCKTDETKIAEGQGVFN